ncbi:GGDEF domain-containing protein [Amycolatopsis eburnea]|uniref:GGDEF domain-containing protein n=1 Tax=Amycolatopsis eburnea TaxID=2267691 RepID=A0A427T8T4_9PSEU|nr:GGDEF domain-containing protein [Amycolatopsis eburnea]RSD17149.1 GGDEF domain-containing protein [Amycolatopsis eburnea]
MTDRECAGKAVRDLRSRWRIASISSGWRFPSDWAVPEVDAVCRAVLSGGDVDGALGGLGRSRAWTGAGLDETLYDVAALHAVLEHNSDGLIAADPGAAPFGMLRAAAVGWADLAGEAPGGAAAESFSGLATEGYLRVRLGEVYRRVARTGGEPVLLVIGLDLSRVDSWSSPMAMVLLADVLRRVFDSGETAAALGRSTAAVLAERDTGMEHRVRILRREIGDRLRGDPQLVTAARPEVRWYPLPESLSAAHDLLHLVAGR